MTSRHDGHVEASSAAALAVAGEASCVFGRHGPAGSGSWDLGPCTSRPGKRTISDETRTRVLAAAERLGYMPKAAARALAGKRSHVIAVTTPLHADTDHSAHMAFAMAVTTAARDHDFDTLLLVQDDALEGMRRTAATRLADGIVVLDPHLTCPVAVETLVGIIEGRTTPGGVRLVPAVHEVRGSVARVRDGAG